MTLPKTLADLSKALRARTTFVPSAELNYNGDFVGKQISDPLTSLAADALDRMAKALEPLRNIIEVWWNDGLDEDRPDIRRRWGSIYGTGSEPPKLEDVELYSGRGGKRLLTLADAFAAHDALEVPGVESPPATPSSARVGAGYDVSAKEPFLPMNAELFGAIWDVLNGAPSAFPTPSEESAFERRARTRLLNLMPGPEAFPGPVDRASYDLAQRKAVIDQLVPNAFADHAKLDEWAKNSPPKSFATDAEACAALNSGDYLSRIRAEYDPNNEVAKGPPAPPPSSVAQADWDDAMASRGKVQGGVFVPDSEAPKVESPTLRGLDEQKPLDRLVFESDLRGIITTLRSESSALGTDVSTPTFKARTLTGAESTCARALDSVANALESALKRKS